MGSQSFTSASPFDIPFIYKFKTKERDKNAMKLKQTWKDFFSLQEKGKKTEATFLRELTFTTRSRAQINLRCQLPAVTHALHHLYRTVELMTTELIPARYRLTMTETTSA